MYCVSFLSLTLAKSLCKIAKFPSCQICGQFFALFRVAMSLFFGKFKMFEATLEAKQFCLLHL